MHYIRVKCTVVKVQTKRLTGDKKKYVENWNTQTRLIKKTSWIEEIQEDRTWLLWHHSKIGRNSVKYIADGRSKD